MLKNIMQVQFMNYSQILLSIPTIKKKLFFLQDSQVSTDSMPSYKKAVNSSLLDYLLLESMCYVNQN